MKITAICAIRFSYCKISPPLKMLYWKNTKGSTCSSKYMTETNSWSLQIPNFWRTLSWIWSHPSRAAVKLVCFGLVWKICSKNILKELLKEVLENGDGIFCCIQWYVELSLLRDNRLSELTAFSQSNVLFGIIPSWPISWPWYYVFVKVVSLGGTFLQ